MAPDERQNVLTALEVLKARSGAMEVSLKQLVEDRDNLNKLVENGSALVNYYHRAIGELEGILEADLHPEKAIVREDMP